MPALARHPGCFLCVWEPVKGFKQRSDVICFAFQNLLKTISACRFQNTHFRASVEAVRWDLPLHCVHLPVSYAAFEI